MCITGEDRENVHSHTKGRQIPPVRTRSFARVQKLEFSLLHAMRTTLYADEFVTESRFSYRLVAPPPPAPPSDGLRGGLLTVLGLLLTLGFGFGTGRTPPGSGMFS